MVALLTIFKLFQKKKKKSAKFYSPPLLIFCALFVGLPIEWEIANFTDMYIYIFMYRCTTHNIVLYISQASGRVLMYISIYVCMYVMLTVAQEDMHLLNIITFRECKEKKLGNHTF